jgi:hypothetical protein
LPRPAGESQAGSESRLVLTEEPEAWGDVLTRMASAAASVGVP